jgi:hypothetical protein
MKNHATDWPVRVPALLVMAAFIMSGCSSGGEPTSPPPDSGVGDTATTDGGTGGDGGVSDDSGTDGGGDAASLTSLELTRDVVMGTRDQNGEWMSGTETMRLMPHEGRLYASLGEWMNVPYGETRGDRPWLGAQVLVKQSASSPWRVEKTFGPDYLRTEALLSLRMLTDAAGTAVNPAVQLLLASAGAVNRSGPRIASVWTRNAAGEWNKADITEEIAGAGARSIGGHVDQVTGVFHVFAGISEGSIFRGVYDPSVPASLRFDPVPELEGTGRPMAITEANGVLYAATGVDRAPSDSLGGGLYRRVDGSNPRWELVYRWPYIQGNRGDEANLMRGLTAVPDPAGGAYDVLLGTRAADDVVERIDPNNGDTVTVDINIQDFLEPIFGSPQVGPLLSAYNDFLPVRHPDTGEDLHLFGVWAALPNGSTEGSNGAHFLVRHLDSAYEHGYLYDEANPVPDGQSLRATRTIAVSPFPEDEGRVFYFGGYDCANQESHDTAWIYRGVLR